MNKLFQATTFTQYSLWRSAVNRNLSVQGAQVQLVADMQAAE